MIEYVFQLPNGEKHSFSIDLDRVYTPELDQADHPRWTALTFSQCENCPLSAERYRNCPAAVDLREIVGRFSAMISHTHMDVTVHCPERSYSKRCDAQSALDSLLGLVMATSACPLLGRLRSLARYHLPFASPDETIFRTVSNYLLRQYFVHTQGGEPDIGLEGLKEFYRELETVNRFFAERVRSASQEDASVNAVVQLSALSMTVTFSIEDQLLELRDEFLRSSADENSHGA